MHDNQPETVTDILTTLKVLGIDLDTESFSSMLDELPVFLWVHDENNTIVYGNREFRENFGTCVKQKCHQCLMGKSEPCQCCLSRKAGRGEKTERCKLCKRRNNGYDINIFHTPITNKEGQKFILKSSFHIKDLGILADHMQREGVEEKPREIFLVMCSSCKRVKDQNENWLDVDNYIVDHFNVRISHGICPDCRDVLYPKQGQQKHTRITS